MKQSLGSTLSKENKKSQSKCSCIFYYLPVNTVGEKYM